MGYNLVTWPELRAAHPGFQLEIPTFLIKRLASNGLPFRPFSTRFDEKDVPFRVASKNKMNHSPAPGSPTACWLPHQRDFGLEKTVGTLAKTKISCRTDNRAHGAAKSARRLGFWTYHHGPPSKCVRCSSVIHQSECFAVAKQEKIRKKNITSVTKISWL